MVTRKEVTGGGDSCRLPFDGEGHEGIANNNNRAT
jgi:hypothetical protein